MMAKEASLKIPVKNHEDVQMAIPIKLAPENNAGQRLYAQALRAGRPQHSSILWRL
jgi:hypothetical protein